MVKSFVILVALGGVASAHPVLPDDDYPVVEDPYVPIEDPVVVEVPVPEQQHYALPPNVEPDVEPPIPYVTIPVTIPDEPPHWRCGLVPDWPPTPAPAAPASMLGFHIGGGKLPILGQELQTTALGISVEHEVWGSLRVFGEYEWLFLGKRDTERKNQDVMDGSGQRAHVGLRRTITASRAIGGFLRFYVDGEAGGGLMLADGSALASPGALMQSAPSAIVRPYGFAGIRFGYDFIQLKHDTRGSRVWEPEIMLRAIKVEDGVGFTAAVGMTWGG